MRDKYRIRYYNGNMDVLRFERKHKHDDMIYKERALLSSAQYLAMCSAEYDFMPENRVPVFDKFYSVHILKQMSPVVMVSYNRQAFTHVTGNVRLTFDTDLSASPPGAGYSFSMLPYDKVIMEIKYDHFIPSYINNLLTGVPFTQQLSLSKYIMARIAIQGI